MHYVGAVTEQLTHEDPQIVLARRHARRRRDARRERRRAKNPWQASLTRQRGQAGIGRHRGFFDWHGILAHHHH